MISATVIAKSVSNGHTIVTAECEIPRIVLAELNTHRVFSRNSASSRAVPVSQSVKKVWKDPFIPASWGKNQRGMIANESLSGMRARLCRFGWVLLSKVACITALSLSKLGLHKQYANRLIEPWAWHKVVITSTEWDNFFALRLHPDAQPEMQILARELYRVINGVRAIELKQGEWHLPYYKDGYWKPSEANPSLDAFGISLELAQKISASCCAQVSYRKNDPSVLKAIQIYDRLVGSKPRHASPFEHQATPALAYGVPFTLPNTPIGVTLSMKDGVITYHSGNLSNWIQFRQLLEQ